MRLKLFKKYFFTTSVIIITSLTVTMLILSFVLNNYIAQSKHETLWKACTMVSEYIMDSESSENIEDTDRFFNIIQSVAHVSDADIFIAQADGRVGVCSCKEWERNKNCLHTSHIIPKNEIEFIGEGEKLRLTTLGIYETPHYVTARPVYIGDGGRLTVFATASISMVKNLLTTLTKLYLFSAIVPIIIMFFAIYAMTYRMTKPLKLMSEASRAMSKGDFSKRIPITSDDEIGELATSFNLMTNTLASLEGMRKSFVANVSHELKTPMTTIGGFIDGILDGTIEPEKHSYYLNIVSEEVKRMSRLVQSMLSMSKLESGEFTMKKELFDLREMIFSVVISQEQRIEKKKLDIKGLDELDVANITADRDLIHQVVYNLVDNAIKFTDDEGEISFSLQEKNKKIIFTLTNSGKGIPQKDLPFVFERFYKVDKARSDVKNSTGLGLYIVKTIVKAHGGRIVVSSKEDEYTTFKLELPIE